MSELTAPYLTPALLSELREVAEAATPGFWFMEDNHGTPCISGEGTADVLSITGHEKARALDNARHIAAFRPDTALDLLAEVSRLTARVKSQQDELGRQEVQMLELVKELGKAKQELGYAAVKVGLLLGDKALAPRPALVPPAL